MAKGSNASVTEQVAEWIVKADYDDIPPIAIERVRNLVLDSLGNQFAGMAVSTGRLVSQWVRAQGAAPSCTVTGAGLQDDAGVRHAGQRRRVARARERRHRDVQQPPEQPPHRSGAGAREKLDDLGPRLRPRLDDRLGDHGPDDEGLGPRGNELINRGWFNQGFQETLGVAALGRGCWSSTSTRRAWRSATPRPRWPG